VYIWFKLMLGILSIFYDMVLGFVGKGTF